MISNRSFTGSDMAVWLVLVLVAAVVATPTDAADVTEAEMKARQSWAPVATSNQPPQPLRDPVDWPQPIRRGASAVSTASSYRSTGNGRYSQQVRLVGSVDGSPIADASQFERPRYADGEPPVHVSQQTDPPTGQNVGLLSDLFGGAIGPGNPTPTHRVIRSPEFKMPKNKLGERYSETHPPHSSHHQRKVGTPAMIPQAKESARWKTPYSYGYFGATGKRSWSKHTGYRDRYTEWILQ
ncbi:secreted protein [Rhodopirellula maiorica SM1]|uniref:Secreted protein n=1 Tax=Rhodopirellula maiorica SM1 TaxID=1265738 RepID=M5RI82_9BACT|nr:hypothetical protein [Rhodopirellula maiorica]EMI19005.1 secreted protein [Rhodopirellula maiorica SM1]